jgi:integrase
MSRTKKKEFPLEIKERGCTVKIYKTPNNGTTQYTLSYHLGAERKRQKFTNLEKAKTEASRALTKLVNGESEALRLTGMDRSIYVHAKETLDEHLPGANLLQAFEEYTAAKKLLPPDVSLKDVCHDWVKRNAFPPKTPHEVLEELIEAKRALGVSAVYLKDLGRLEKFCKAHNRPLLSITVADVEQFLDGLKAAARTRNNYRRNLTTVFQFASRRGYAPKNYDLMDGVAKARTEEAEVEIFSPVEFQEMMAAARQEMISYLAIAAFAGLRAAEIQRLDWKEVNLAERHIEIKAAKSKTASRRLVPITDNLYLWLASRREESGQVAQFENMAKQIDWLVRDINKQRVEAKKAPDFSWKHNGLRHSFISYRLATEKDTAQVALEAGNSPNMIFKHYRQLVTEAEANRWFAIKPAGEENLTPMPKEVSAAI